jgi:hypothetical protein
MTNDHVEFNIPAQLILWVIALPCIWLSCAWVTVSRADLGLYPLGIAVLATFIVIFVPMISYGKT